MVSAKQIFTGYMVDVDCENKQSSRTVYLKDDLMLKILDDFKRLREVDYDPLEYFDDICLTYGFSPEELNYSQSKYLYQKASESL